MANTSKKRPRAKRLPSLRQRAEAARRQGPRDITHLSPADVKQLIYDLEVHQIELEVQNEELQVIQSELADSRDRLRDLYDFAPIGYMTIGPGTVVQEVNLVMAKMLGVERQKLIGRRFTAFVTSESQDVFYKHQREVFASELKQTCELLLRRADNTEFTARLETVQDQDQDHYHYQDPIKQKAMMRVSVSDITERIQVEGRLRESEERLRLALEGGELGSWDVDVRTGHARWNRRHALMQGYQPVDGPVSIDLWRARVHPDDCGRVMAAIEWAKRERGLFAEEHRLVGVDSGNPRWLSLYGRFYYDEAGEPVRFSGVSLDITDRKRAEAVLQEAHDELERRVAERTRELAQVNATLRASEENLRRHQAQLQELTIKLLAAQESERRRIARELHDDMTQRMAALAIDLQYVSSRVPESVQMGSLPLTELGRRAEELTTDLQHMAHQLHPAILEHVGLEAAVREHAEEFEARTGMKMGIMAPDFPETIPLDHATCLYRVLQESLQNVRKHANATTVSIKLLKTARGVGICVHDDGQGFKQLQLIGQPSGMGLTSMAERVKALHGTFRVKMKPGVGAEIHAWMPLGQGEA